MTTQQTFAFMEFATPSVPSVTGTRTAKMQTVKPATLPPQQKTEKQTPAISVSKPASPAELSNAETDRKSILDRLRQKARCVTASSTKTRMSLPTGCFAIDQELLQGGLRADAVTEWIADSDSSGAAALSMAVAANCLRLDRLMGPIVIVDTNHSFFPPAAISLGIPADRMILVRPHCHRDCVWAIDQALRCEAVAAVWSIVRSRLNDCDARRFQLAAEEGCTTGLLVRPASARGQANFADARLHVKRIAAESAPQRKADASCSSRLGTPLEVTLDRGRGHSRGKRVWVQIDDSARLQSIAHPQTRDAAKKDSHDKTTAVHLASQLAHPKPSSTRTSPDRKRRA
ncbi:ImuA family protein [Novipirellula aureliae]|uniref:ImuA family protein n=1 Tax=Novipirellula aureliae TaxID=2527966 RepID=UPI0018CD7E5A|nr:hypothetical protein [Novipirellula aureliae]